MTRYQNNITLPDNYNSQLEEKKILKFWTKQQIFEKIQSARRENGTETTSFHCGPVFPTGSPHPGHILNGVVKDALTRYGHQKNRLVESRFGWDCHGLPVEHLVDKEFGVKSAKDVQTMGIPAYNEECRKFVQRHAAKWKSVYERVGNWVDFSREYQTMSTDYMERVWCVFKQLYDKGLVYQDTKVLPYSTSCRTHLSNFEVEQNCKEVTESGMNICVDIVDSDEKLLIWTTTPWALVSNSAVRVNPKALYVRVKVADVVYILSKNRLPFVFKNPSEYMVLEEFLGETLQELKYVPLFDPIPVSRDLHVLLDGSISDEIGTGIVPLDEIMDMESLKERGRVLSVEEVKYKKPFCWRSDTPLINKKVSSWFIRVGADKLLESNSQIEWFPDEEKKHFADWLKNHSQDWAVSRSRYWGTPIPIWSSESGDEIVCVGSIEELKQLTGKQEITDLHRECVDWMVIPSRTPGKPPLRRVTEVFDCWFESGALPFASGVEAQVQAEFVAEGIDQTRGWFYTTLVLSTSLSQSTPFRNVFPTGLVREPDGSKVSKRKHNHNDPTRLIEKYGADCLRLYLLSSPLVKCESFSIEEEGVANIDKTVIQPLYRIFYNCTSQLGSPSWINYGYVTCWYGFAHVIDQWIISCTESLLKFYDSEMKAYRLHTIVPRVIQLIKQVEDWYIPIRRPKPEPVATDRSSIIVFNVIYRLTLILAPFAPFFSEYLYQIHRPFHIQWRRKESIHDALLIPLDGTLIHKDLEQRVSRMQTVVETVRALRTQHIVPNRYKISEVVVIHHNGIYLHDIELLKEIIMKLLNANDVRLSKDHHEFGATLKAELSTDSAISGNQQIMSAIRGLSEEEVESLIQDDPFSVLNQTIPLDDIQLFYQISKETESNYAVVTKDDLIVAIRMNKRLFYYEEGTVKDIANRIRSLKEEGGYYANDSVVIHYSTKDECLRNVIVKYGEHLNKTANCNLRLDTSDSTEKDWGNNIVGCASIKGLPISLHLNCI